MIGINSITDITVHILCFVDYDAVVQKELTVVCKQWKVMLENYVPHNIQKFPDYKKRLDFAQPARLSINTIAVNIDSVDWANLPVEHVLSEEFIEMFQANLIWNTLCYRRMPEEFIEKHQDKVCWRRVSARRGLSDGFIEKYQDKLNWWLVSRAQILSEYTIEKHQDRVDWETISRCQILSEEFIEKHQDKVNWYCIERFQQLSDKFRIRFAHLLG